MLHFVLGGARSGKSRFAENLAKQQEKQGKTVYYVATAKVSRIDEKGRSTLDQEMQQRIEMHQSDRPSHWQTIETPIELSQTLQSLDDAQHCILVDCLTLWTLNLLEKDSLIEQKQSLLTCVADLSADVILVSNEVGMGIVPLGELTRQYVDELGWLHQEIATLSDDMTFMVAGQPMPLKSHT
ncbi:MAG: bifunctional adenosylcobinamide kinase/adenosylcobinamide-phosphate guanylyltransferase [Pseudomonadota bacterium]|nr:bifunctional adenosylcobinamide kinase/adenosylcobinamide-phosphate guanylyltransferase [Pseudomonadota bacterium]